MLNPGFQRLVILDSAGYIRAEMPLDDSVSLIGENNKGKTSLINALQFLLIIDKRRMDFGAHSLDKSRRFYFSGNSSYILLEVLLPQTGIVVLGAVGKGLSGDYQYFAYKGELNLNDYRMEDGNLVPQTKLISHLSTHGHMVYSYDDKEFRERVYGGARKKRKEEPDFTVFKLEYLSDAKAYQQVLTKTLKLDKLTSSLVKDYLLTIFSRDLSNSAIDFKQEWENAFNEVNREREQYDAAVRNASTIQQMEEGHQHCLTLRGKLICLRPLVDEALEQWHGYYLSESERLKAGMREQEQKGKQLLSEHGQKKEFQINLKRSLNELNEQTALQISLEKQFMLIPNRSMIESQIDSTKDEYGKQVVICSQLQIKSTATIERQLNEKNMQRKQFENQLSTLKDNLYLELAKHLSTEELERVNKVFNTQVFQLSAESFSLDFNVVKSALVHSDPDTLTALGITLSLEQLLPQFNQLSESQVLEQISQLDEEIKELETLHQASQQAQKAHEEKARLEKAYRELEKKLEQYDSWQKLISEKPEREREGERLNNELKNVNKEIEAFSDRTKSLIQQQKSWSNKKSTLDTGNDTVGSLRDKRIDGRELFQYMADHPHHPWYIVQKWQLEQLPDNLESYYTDCCELENQTKQLREYLRTLQTDGLTKYQTTQTRDKEIESIIKFSHCLDDEKRTLERMARSAVVNVMASLKELRSGLHALQNKMLEFNRLISRRQLSDLRLFKIKTVEEKSLVDAIDLLIQQAEQSDSGQNFDLFNQKSFLDDVHIDRAKQVLIDEGNVRQGLRVADLFRLEFVVAKHGHNEESFEDIDSAASNGTVLMAKLVTGLAMLHLMQDKRHQVKAVCYLDEALALDSVNQANLVEIAKEFGFSLIFASPSPLTTVRYCVPISQVNGKNCITRKSWQIFEPIEKEELEPV